MTFTLTAAKKIELKKMAKETGISYEALVDSEKSSAILAEGGLDALEAAGYHVTRSTVK
jgi:hypothetical protein